MYYLFDISSNKKRYSISDKITMSSRNKVIASANTLSNLIDENFDKDGVKVFAGTIEHVAQRTIRAHQ